MPRRALRFQDDVPGVAVPPEWRATLVQQVEKLELLIRRVTDIAASIRRRRGLDASQRARLLEELVAEASQLLTEQVEHATSLEREIEEIKVAYADDLALSSEAASRLYVMEQVNRVFHANLVVARRRLEAIVPR